MKKFLALIIALVMALSLVACGEQKQPDNPDVPDDGQQTATVKVGFITLHDENSTYDLNFINAAKEAIANLGLTDADYILKTNVPEGQECYDKAAELADDGCNIIFADSFGHEDYMIQAAKEFPNVQFCHSTGTKAHTEGLANYHNAFASIYEGRYLAGIAAGLKLNEMIEAGKFTAGLYSFPTTYVVDKNGNIVGQPIVGGITAPDQAKKLNELIDQALASSK